MKKYVENMIDGISKIYDIREAQDNELMDLLS